MSPERPTLVVLTGPTASGKTSLALELARRFPVEIVGADSLQIFRHLDIGTAKPSATERARVPHHMIDLLDPDAQASAAWYAAAARKAVGEILSRKRVPLVVGGSGFYLRALERPPAALSAGPAGALLPEATYAEIEARDPEAAAKIHPNDRYRISRAAALLRAGNLPSALWENARRQEPRFRTVWLAIAHPRATLGERIDRRVEEMFRRGILEETEAVRARFPGAAGRLSRAIGYKQALAILEGTMTRGEAAEDARRKTRRYAKRQLTWFRREPRIEWLEAERALGAAGRAVEKAVPR